MSVDWGQFWGTLGSTVVVVGVLGWVARTWIAHLFSLQIQAYRASLELTASRELQLLRCNLESVTAHSQTRFTVLHERRAKVIEKSYAQVDRVQKAAASFLQPMEFNSALTKREKYVKLAEVGNELKEYFDEHRVFFSQHVCAQFDALFGSMYQPTQRFFFALDLADQFDDDRDMAKEKTKSWIEGYKSFDAEVPKFKEALEQEFRMLLGVMEPCAVDIAHSNKPLEQTDRPCHVAGEASAAPSPPTAQR